MRGGEWWRCHLPQPPGAPHHASQPACRQLHLSNLLLSTTFNRRLLPITQSRGSSLTARRPGQSPHILVRHPLLPDPACCVKLQLPQLVINSRLHLPDKVSVVSLAVKPKSNSNFIIYFSQTTKYPIITSQMTHSFTLKKIN